MGKKTFLGGVGQLPQCTVSLNYVHGVIRLQMYEVRTAAGVRVLGRSQ